MKHLLSFLLALFLIQPASAAETTVLTPTIRAGQTIVAKFDTKPSAITFDGKPVNVFPYNGSYRAVIPTARTISVGSHTLSACFTHPTANPCISQDTSVMITQAYTKLIVLPVPPKLNQTPAQVVQNLNASNTNTAQITSVINPPHISTGFGLPLWDNRIISSPFGEVRQTGDERITHYGTDFVMPKGSAVAAINAGVISKAYLDPIYGNTVIVDHGAGIYSVYMHLNSMKVVAGQNVYKGQMIGTLGETGLASAPHLHLTIKINGQSVDPLQFVNNFR